MGNRPRKDVWCATVVVGLLVIMRVIVGPDPGMMYAVVILLDLIVAIAAATTALRVRSIVPVLAAVACGVLACLSAPMLDEPTHLTMLMLVAATVLGIVSLGRSAAREAV